MHPQREAFQSKTSTRSRSVREGYSELRPSKVRAKGPDDRPGKDERRKEAETPSRVANCREPIDEEGMMGERKKRKKARDSVIVGVLWANNGNYFATHQHCHRDLPQ
jgi:hypothetical protein